jgi:hypothetical protein
VVRKIPDPNIRVQVLKGIADIMYTSVVYCDVTE